MKYVYKLNGKVWKEVTVTEYAAPEKTEKFSMSIAFYVLIFAICGIPGGLGAYVAPEAWGGLFIGLPGVVLSSTLEDDDADVRIFLTIFCASAAAISLVRVTLLMFASLS